MGNPAFILVEAFEEKGISCQGSHETADELKKAYKILVMKRCF